DGIFVGNSNTSTSNHIDAFSFIHKIRSEKRKILVPLSYGGDYFYKIAVLAAGKRYFGLDFQPMRHFLDRTAYTERMAECKTAVFMHIRQQAIGNIFIALWLGLKVFVLKTNPCFDHFESKGIAIYPIDESLGIEFNSPLSMDLKISNRQLLLSHFGQDEVYQKIQVMLTEVSAGK
nr:TDP-N-acetylfucosamine:lipid II N-acetylfucosaminyltransferase [Chitinophagaceae bacterium]